MKGFNKTILMGNLARDPELKYTFDRRAMARFAVAVNNAWKDKNGDVQESVDFINVKVWGRLAEWCEQWLRKGQGVLVEGRIRTGSYEAKDGSGKRYTFDVEAMNITLVGGKPKDRQDNTAGPSDDDYGQPVHLPPSGEAEGPDQDIPF